jgi:hypothetical protein
MKDKKVTNAELLRLATHRGTRRPGDARHVTPTNVSRLQKILDMHPSKRIKPPQEQAAMMATGEPEAADWSI